ncbi:MAG TPA: DNA recombination/repair protein RecA, partial [Candidatus Dormibacteraeota bacterium]|nr:DNA recombination/repair protein RecA [Candidatus Dormibacteraeota bacterium]
MDKERDKERDKAVEEKKHALDAAMSQITKTQGKGAIMRLGEHVAQRGEVSVIPTGALPLDLALGVGGIPRGRVTELYGPESAGKTTLAL